MLGNVLIIVGAAESRKQMTADGKNLTKYIIFMFTYNILKIIHFAKIASYFK